LSSFESKEVIDLKNIVVVRDFPKSFTQRYFSFSTQ